jgi:L-2-amino-thiazoline-4-carboxylic acid hydrolase
MSNTPDHAPQAAGAGGYRRDPDADSQALVALFFECLDRDLAASGVAGADRQALQEDMHAHYNALLRAAGDVPDEPARYNQRYVTAIVAAYRALLARDLPPGDGAQYLVARLTAAFVEPLAPTITEVTRAMLDAAPDPFAAMVSVARARESEDFGAAFHFEHPLDDDERFYADVHRCGYHDLLTQYGAPELTPVLCAFDANWIRAIDPDRHHFTFTRDTTIGLGGPICPFHFQRTRSA